MITLCVRNMAESITLYERDLGLPRIESPPEVAYNPHEWIGPVDKAA